MCVQTFHMVNIDVPAGVGAPPLNKQLKISYMTSKPVPICNFLSEQKSDSTTPTPVTPSINGGTQLVYQPFQSFSFFFFFLRKS